jgi:hypothetical protein
MSDPSSEDLANVQNYLMYKGHACPTIYKDEVHFIDQTRGHHRFVRHLKISEVLEEIRLLRRVDVEDYTDKTAFVAGSQRFGIGPYQVMEIKDKLVYREEFRIERQQQLES